MKKIAEIKKFVKKIPFSGKVCIAIVIISLLFAASVLTRVKASSIGNDMGVATGSGVGTLVGSIEGVAAIGEAVAAGTAAGLSNEDTVSKIAENFAASEKLEVFVASVTLKDMHKIGDDDYASLYLLKGDAIYTVDLGASSTEWNGEEMVIMIPEPVVELVISQRNIDKVAEYQKGKNTGRTEQGFDDYLNMMSSLSKEPEEALANYDDLMETAKEVAKKQIREIALSMSVNMKNIRVEFLKEEDK